MDNVFIGLGSNLNHPQLQLNSAIENLKEIKESQLLNISDFYQSEPMGPQEQPDYINAVVEMSTALTAEQLLHELQEIENKQGRVREQRWGARTLDLDILLFGNEIINTEYLTVPHYGISERNFVLYPLSDLVDSTFKIPNAAMMSELLAACPVTGIKRLKKYDSNG